MITVQGQLLEMLQSVANALGEDLRKRLVFVGGCTTALFITDPVTIEGVRTTDDVDLIVDLEGFSEWAALLYELRQRGFSEAADETVICRMRLGPLKVDFMPDDEAILGFSNRWYAKGIETATQKALNDSLVINILTPPLFIATKLEAFTGRGNNDLYLSRDAEDILLVVDGREGLLMEIQVAEKEVRAFIADGFRALMAHQDFDDFLDGNLRGQAGRADVVRERFLTISQVSDGDLNAH